MFRKVMMIGLFGISVVAMLETRVYASRLVDGYGFDTKGVVCKFMGAGIGRDEVNITAGVCNVLNVHQAIFWCKNRPGQTPQSHISTRVVTFEEGIALAHPNKCDRKGHCRFEVIVNAEDLDQTSSGCVSPQWIVEDVVPVAFDFILELVECFTENNEPVDCDSSNAAFSTVDQRTGHCDLPDPQTLQFKEQRAYVCVED